MSARSAEALQQYLHRLCERAAHGETILSGEFKDAAARDLAQPEDRDLARGGEAQVWFKGTQIIKYRIEIFLKGRRGIADVDGIATSIGLFVI